MLQKVKWGEYKLGDLFDIKGNPQLNKDSFAFSDDYKDGKYPYFTRTVFNNGILGYVDYLDDEHKIKGNCLAVGMIAMQFFYMEKDFYAGQFTKRAIPKTFSLTPRIANYFISLLNKNQQILQNVLVRNFENTFNDTLIQLPTKNGKIDFDFMEKFIAELEAERIAELEAYLSATGLQDCTLTREEEKALEEFESGKIVFGEFKIGELFEINSSIKRFDANKITISEIGKPYVARTSLNNGIRGYVNEDEQFLNEGNTISFGQDTATMFYQEKPYFTGDKIKIVKSKDNKLNKNNALFFISTMEKSFSSFSWGGSSFNVKILVNQVMQLPTNGNKPDYKTMETLISAVQKLVIKDVVLYADRKIEATKAVIKGGR